jgi:hypothetical protein
VGLLLLMIFFSWGSFNYWIWVATNANIMGIHCSTIATLTPTLGWEFLFSCFNCCFYNGHSFLWCLSFRQQKHFISPPCRFPLFRL